MSRVKAYGNLIKLICMAGHRVEDRKDTLIINAVIQSGMSWLLHCVKDSFRKIVIVGHPSTLLYCRSVLGKEAYKKQIVWVRNLAYEKIKNAAILADDENKICDMFVDLDYYNVAKQNKAVIFPYYQQPARFYHVSEKEPEEIQRETIPVRVFGCGAIPQNGYPLLAESFPGMMNRTEIVDVLCDSYKERICNLSEKKDLNREAMLFAFKDARKGDEKYLLNSEEFVQQLEASDFYIAAPGNGMPHCHNIMEAMSRGAIPITNYADYMMPPLTNDVNCLAFMDADSLKTAIEKALSMTEEEVLERKRNVRLYYENYCQEESIRALLGKYFYKRQKKMLLCNDEGNSIRLHIEQKGTGENREED